MDIETKHEHFKTARPTMVLDHMITNNSHEYTVTPWQVNAKHYWNVYGYSGKVEYNEDVFIITHIGGRATRGGMDMGTPDRIEIMRV